MTTVVQDTRVWFTGKQIAEAILFHLEDERWFKPIPDEITNWLHKQLPETKRVSFKSAEWRQGQTGTRRMLWLMLSAQIDPFYLCKFKPYQVTPQVMHRRFTDIIDTWAESD